MKRLSACALSLALSVSMILPAGAAGATFSDVPQGHWAYDSVERMVQEGVMEGVGGGRFAPDEWLSTAEFSVMLTQAFCPEKISGLLPGEDLRRGGARLVGALCKRRKRGGLPHRHHRWLELYGRDLGRRRGRGAYEPL